MDEIEIHVERNYETKLEVKLDVKGNGRNLKGKKEGRSIN